MTRGTLSPDDTECIVQNLVDPADWIADDDRVLCNVCSRSFGTFRRKHHCRVCGEVVCSACTLHKTAQVPTIGTTRVRVCVSCLFHAATASPKHFFPCANAPAVISPGTASEESREWLHSHLHSPIPRGTTGSDSMEDDDEDIDEWVHHPADVVDATEYGQARRSEIWQQRIEPVLNQNNQAVGSGPTKWTHPWPKPPVIPDEEHRLDALHALQILDSERELCYDAICDLAKIRMGCPMAAVSFIDGQRQWFKARVGLAYDVIPRKIAFCAHTIARRGSMVVLDALLDQRFDCNPLVSGAAALRFYAGAPIFDKHTGHAIGTVFVLDTRPRETCDITLLETLAEAASQALPDRVDSRRRASQLRQEQQQTASGQYPRRHEKVVLATRASQASQTRLQSFASTSSFESESSAASASAAVAAPSSLSMKLATTATISGESLEVLLLRLLTQSTETQQQLALQQLTLKGTLAQHKVKLSDLIHTIAIVEARIDARLDRKMKLP